LKTPPELDAELASPIDFEAILRLYHEANQSLLKQGIIQWNDEYPSPDTLYENLVNGTTWILRQEGKLIASITLDNEQDPQYEFIDWAYSAQ